MVVIMKGDDTASNKRGIKIQLPDDDIGEGFEVIFELLGIVRRGGYEPGGFLEFNYTREETSAFPLGISFGTVRLAKNDLQQTISNTVPVKVTDAVCDSIAAVKSAEGCKNTIDISVVVNTGIQRIDKASLTQGSSVADIKALANAILEAINAST